MPYALAIFVASASLFLIEPIAGKRVLPLLGGSAAVWTTCLVFFQLALLAGYLVAHWLTTSAGPRRQATIYLTLIALSVAQLVFAAGVAPTANTNRPVSSVLWLLTILIGLPFVTLAITSPLLQAWYVARRADQSAIAQPYRLYAVSNVGSLLALLVYPSLIEPRTTLHEQGLILVAAVVLLGLLCIAIVRSLPATKSPSYIGDAGAIVRVRTQLFWVALAACGSVLLCAITNHISQNVAAIPLLWIAPLVAYLASFIVAFSDERWHPRPSIVAAGLFGLLLAGYRLYDGDLHISVLRSVVEYCVALFALCLFCHGELYRRRPHASRLTGFYFCLAAGGALGAILVGIVAPITLPNMYEFRVGLCAVALLGLIAVWDYGADARVGAVIATIGMLGLVRQQVLADRMAALVWTRNFYGALHVTQDGDEHLHAHVRTLYNGIIEHGQQVYRADLVNAATTYYGRSSGVGLAVNMCCGDGPRRIGVIGLGTGTMAAYGRPGDVVRFYDINPAVEPIARRYFSYLAKSNAKVDVVTGDARVSLAAEPPQRYDVLAIDAFSGDAIPVHLITVEALELYRRHIRPNGVIAFHISNRYLNLAPVVKQLADHAGMSAVLISSYDDIPHGVLSAEWVLVTSNAMLIDALEYSKDRETITVPPGLRRWTDDYNSLLPILRTRRDSTR